MADYSYSTVPGKIPEILKKIKNIGVPSKVDGSWLKSIGFTSSNDLSLITTLKSIGFIDNANIPTSLWKRYRSDDKALAEGIVLAYQDLFNLYHDANKRSKEELSHFFKTKSSAGAQAISKTVSTFTNLCSVADFANLNTSVRQVENDEDKEDTITSPLTEKASESI
ncbi:MAG TPA: DUF5343 domain-containing protein, partial [Saprospiraceae bacterium]|nr:DUF5343 domain-containing protein [Saprospiraceae bacterium]